MKYFLRFFSFAAVLVLIFSACNKVAELPVNQNGIPAVLASSTNSLAPKVEDSSKVGLTLIWTYPNHATDAKNIKYVVEIDSAGRKFSSPLKKEIVENLSVSYTNKELNRFFIKKKYEPGKQVTLEARVISSYTNNNEPIQSNLISIKFTPYSELINYEFPQALRVAGNFQGWDPPTAPKIVDPGASGTTGNNYEGYINFANPMPEFKLVKGSSWSAGDFGDAGAGLLSNGGSNFMLSGAGVYLMKASTQGMTWSATKINSWGIIGSATPNGWTASTPMTMNSNGTYSITTTLTAGNELKFRANDDWAINFVDNKSNGPDGLPEYNGDNIVITSDGTYLVTLDVSLAGNYSYSLKKQ